MSRRRLLTLLVLCVAACTPGDRLAEKPQAARWVVGDSLLPLDSVLLGETDSASFYVGRPIAFNIAPSGDIYISDQFARRVLVFDPRGRPVRQYGTDGSGPGSFGAPGAIAFAGPDSLIIADWIRDILYFYGGDSLLPARSMRVRGAALRVQQRRDTLWIGVFNAARQSGLAWLPPAGEPQYVGPMPAFYKERPELLTSFGFSTTSVEDSTVLLSYALVPRVYRVRTDGSVVDSVDLPKRLRRTATEDLADAARRYKSFEEWMNGTSTVTAVQVLPDSSIIVVLTDHEVRDNVVGGQNYLSILDHNLRPLCTDIILRYPASVRPLVAFRSDTLYTLAQDVRDSESGGGGVAESYVRRYVVGRQICSPRTTS